VLTKLWAILDTYKALKEGLEFLIRSWNEYQLATYGSNLDEKQLQRNAYLAQIKIAQENRDEESLKNYSRLLAAL
jgi:hypothetical protein